MSDAFDLSQAAFDGSPNIADWPITSPVTAVEVNHRGVIVSTPRLDGVGRWPDFVPPGWDGPLQYTLWIALRLSGVWHVAAALSFWHGRGTHGDDAGGDVLLPDQIAKNWLYDGRFGALQHAQPAVGELVGFFVAAGSQRFDPGVLPTVRERSNVVLLSWPAQPETFTFTPAPPPGPEPPSPPPPAPDPVLSRLAALELRVQALELRVRNLEQAPALPGLPDYYGEGRAPWFGGTVRVTSKPVA